MLTKRKVRGYIFSIKQEADMEILSKNFIDCGFSSAKASLANDSRSFENGYFYFYFRNFCPRKGR